ncbi:response regulator [Sphingomonas changnyeongensis]|uniref:histidine kinase n=1 Tax=Sphingomonas changnyeongensis TaxID=2698679 RepID=A0A7Z2NVB5_9SPHN|nr:ATP-binding protein [Sphingomonas changnyeongensis]QHL90397.1 response regulator [Sphingomonas changnyeongensis]
MADPPLPQDGDRDLTGLRRGLVAGFALLAALALVVLIGMVSTSNAERDAALRAQRHSFEVMNLARTLEATMTRSEAALGRYVVSGDAQTGRYYFDQWRRAGTLLTRLRQIVRDNPAQVKLVDRLQAIYDLRGDQLADVALRTNYNQGWNALGRYFQAGQSKSVTELADTMEAIITAERNLLIARTGAATRSVERSNRLARILSLFGAVVVMGAIILAYAAIQEMTQRRLARREADDEARRADELEAAVAARTAELRDANAALRAEAAEREAAEAQLRQVQKMDAVGQLTGGIAHDFNNMLAVVLGGLELARRRAADRPDDALRHIDNAMDGARRAAALTRRLLAFARAEPLLPEAISADTLIAGMTELLDRTLGERIRVETGFAGGDWLVWVDRQQLENALLNLAVNARDAMDGEGTVSIATSRRSLAAGEAGALPAGDHVAITVADTGCGMDPAVLERVFEPFFTTKPVGKGTGLGLSQVFGFVGQSGGEVLIDSAPGRGTTVTLLLPRHCAAAAAAPIAADTEPAAQAGTTPPARILVVEDDPRVLAATTEALAELGHHPVPCPDPEQAEALMRDHPDIRLVISDVVMPRLTGPELIARLHPRHPQVGVLFVTGYAGDAGGNDAFAGHEVLRKPFTIGALERAVGRALARGGMTRDPAGSTAQAALG